MPADGHRLHLHAEDRNQMTREEALKITLAQYGIYIIFCGDMIGWVDGRFFRGHRSLTLSILRSARSVDLRNADERTRTSTELLPQRPERCASTSSATSATEVGILLIVIHGCQGAVLRFNPSSS